MKIGILSMQRIYNYGSWLQAYGLKKMLEEFEDIDISFVDYRIEKPFGISKGNYIKQNIKIHLIDALTRCKWIAKAISDRDFYHVYCFRNEYQKLLGINYKKNYSPNLDILLIGSDEVFNCLQDNVRVGYSKELFGENNNAKKVCSYAASFGNTTNQKIENARKGEEISSWLKKFHTISVRDQNSYEVVKKLTGIKPEVHMDPVLMYDFTSELSKISNVKHEKPYMIVYAYPNRLRKQEIEQIKKYAREKKLDIYGISGYQNFADKMIYDSPLNILGYFRDAECVVTDTFHGTIFSVINSKPFITIVRPSVNGEYGNQEKLDDLLNKLELGKRSVQELTSVVDVMDEEVDYNSVEKIIKSEREKTKQYLKDMIGNE